MECYNFLINLKLFLMSFQNPTLENFKSIIEYLVLLEVKLDDKLLFNRQHVLKYGRICVKQISSITISNHFGLRDGFSRVNIAPFRNSNIKKRVNSYNSYRQSIESVYSRYKTSVYLDENADFEPYGEYEYDLHAATENLLNPMLTATSCVIEEIFSVRRVIAYIEDNNYWEGLISQLLNFVMSVMDKYKTKYLGDFIDNVEHAVATCSNTDTVATNSTGSMESIILHVSVAPNMDKHESTTAAVTSIDLSATLQINDITHESVSCSKDYVSDELSDIHNSLLPVTSLTTEPTSTEIETSSGIQHSTTAIDQQELEFANSTLTPYTISTNFQFPVDGILPLDAIANNAQIVPADNTTAYCEQMSYFDYLDTLQPVSNESPNIKKGRNNSRPTLAVDTLSKKLKLTESVKRNRVNATLSTRPNIPPCRSPTHIYMTKGVTSNKSYISMDKSVVMHVPDGKQCSKDGTIMQFSAQYKTTGDRRKSKWRQLGDIARTETSHGIGSERQVDIPELISTVPLVDTQYNDNCLYSSLWSHPSDYNMNTILNYQIYTKIHVVIHSTKSIGKILTLNTGVNVYRLCCITAVKTECGVQYVTIFDGDQTYDVALKSIIPPLELLGDEYLEYQLNKSNTDSARLFRLATLEEYTEIFNASLPTICHWSATDVHSFCESAALYCDYTCTQSNETEGDCDVIGHHDLAALYKNTRFTVKKTYKQVLDFFYRMYQPYRHSDTTRRQLVAIYERSESLLSESLK